VCEVKLQSLKIHPTDPKKNHQPRRSATKAYALVVTQATVIGCMSDYQGSRQHRHNSSDDYSNTRLIK